MSIAKFRFSNIVLVFLLLSLSLEAKAQQGQNFFTGSPPTFNGEESPFKSVYIPSAHYYFKFTLPRKSNTAIAKILIEPQPNIEEIVFSLPDTIAFIGIPDARGAQIQIASVEQDPVTRIITVTFAQSILPGTDFTVSLEAIRNPSTSGTYQFRLYALPVGNSPVSMDLGLARFRIYSFGSH